MCMLFAFLNQEAAADEMALVVASIRDEYVNRPTRQASFWREDSRIIGGESVFICSQHLFATTGIDVIVLR